MGGQPDEITQTSEAPAYVQPYIRDVLSQGQNMYRNFTPGYFPGSTVAPLSPYTQQGAGQLAAFGDSSFNQGTIANAQQAQGQLANAGQNPAALIGTNQALNSSPFYDFLRAQGVSGAPYLFSSAQQGQSFAGPARDVNVTPGTSSPTAVEGAASDVNAGAAIQGTLDRAPGGNPYVDELVQRTLQANTREFQQNALPSIQNAAQISGGFGGSRQGVAEGIALQGLADANARTSAGIYSDQYGQDLSRQLQAAGLASQLQGQSAQSELGRLASDRGFGLGTEQLTQNVAGQDLARMLQAAQFGGGLGAQGQSLGLQGSALGQGLLVPGINAGVQGSQSALGLAPALQQMGLAGTQSMLGAGDVENAYWQALLNDEVNRFNFSQAQPYASLQNYTNAVYGLPGLGGQQVTSPTESGGFAGALGGAATGVGLLGAAQSAGLIGAGVASGPVGWGVVGLGALLGLL